MRMARPTADGIGFRISRAALRQIALSGAVRDRCHAEAVKVKNRAESFGTAEYGVKDTGGANRAHSVVYTPSMHAINSNALHNSLARAIRGKG